MKKLLAILLAVAMVACMFCLASCDSGKEPAKETDPAATDAPTAEVTDPATDPATEAPEDPDPAYNDNYVLLTGKVDTANVEGAGAKDDGSEDAVYLFDGDSATKWCQIVKTEDGTTTIQWAMTKATKVDAYTFTSANDSPERFPADWVLYGSNDGEEWTEVDTVEGATRVEEFFTESGIFECDAPAAYTNYKIHFTKNGTEGTIIYQISELTLLGAKA